MTVAEKRYRPFSNGTEFDSWQSANCQCCSLCNINEYPTCKGDEGLTLALFDNGQISEEVADYIGTQRREVQDEGTHDEEGFCTLNQVCNHFQSRI